jgi:hypothetical protein
MRRFLSFDDFELQVLQKALAEFQSAIRSASLAGPAREADREEKAAAGDLYQEARGEQRHRRAAPADGPGGDEAPAAGLAGAERRGMPDA